MSYPAQKLGPWFYVQEGSSGEFFGCGVSKSEGGPEFIWFDDSIEVEHDIAASHLIAAAPEMLAVLRKLHLKLPGSWDCESVPGGLEAWQDLLSVLRKAEGRS